ncbi:MAG TPA: toll/interleukin-1 receptor domain-containing protein [Candidatus Acidoferrum sp.]|nr:toll/interleukin-1 receptor domain-containing protein [Candidatus Acidoferrum sp.]
MNHVPDSRGPKRGPEADRAPLVFVSYAHEDEKFLKDELLPFLQQLEELGHVELWHDRNIGVGEDWYAEISDKLDQARVAVLLLSQPFLASKFCRHEEVPVLLQRARAGRLTLQPLLLDHCLYELEPWLKRLQIRPKDTIPLSMMSKAQRSETLKAFARETLAATRPGYEPPQNVRREVRPDRYNLDHLPDTGDLLFGRAEELRRLDRAWAKQDGINVVVFRAGGGVGKSALVRTWTDLLAEDKWRGTERAFGWSFYSQGTGRAASSDRFVDAALRWWREDPASIPSHWDRAERLVECVRRERTLLVLDGIEPLQSAGPIERGRINDPALRVLIESLAEENPGLCVVTTREELVDLRTDVLQPRVAHIDLEQVSPQAGRALLRVQRVRGEDSRLEEVVRDLGCHALAVSLFASYASDSPGRSVEVVAALPPLAHAIEDGGHPRRAMEAWVQRLGAGPEIDLLHGLGLFDRPAEMAPLEALFGTPRFKRLNDHLVQKALTVPLARLRASRLIAAPRRETSNDVDAHPLVREHFGFQLKERAPEAWIEGHRRLYEHYRKTAPDLPETLVEMEPLFAAVVHGAASGRHQEVLQGVLIRRILRERQFFLYQKLGAFQVYLGCLASFFIDPWIRPAGLLTPKSVSWLLAEAGYTLRALGRLHEAVKPIEAALDRGVNEHDWQNVVNRAYNLSELHQFLGDLPRAEALAREAIEHADRSPEEFYVVAARTRAADVLHQRGDLDAAQALFEDAESRQGTRRPSFPFLDALDGYSYCELLLERGEAAEVARRAAWSLERVTAERWLLPIALDHVSLGRAHVALGSLEPARRHFDRAVENVRAAGQLDDVPRGLLARAAFRRAVGDLVQARRDLLEARKLVERLGLRLFAADCVLEEARLALAESKHEGPNSADAQAKLGEARAALRRARLLVDEMGYGRRRPELAELARVLGENPEGT